MKWLLILLVLFVIGCGNSGNKITGGVVGIPNNAGEVSINESVQLSYEEMAIERCIDECKKSNRINMDEGPCLSNAIIPGWVCDVAHNPRESVDNIGENQCSEYGKSARHFVEVNPNCELIRTF